MKFLKSYESLEMDRVAVVECEIFGAPVSTEEQSIALYIAACAAATGRQDSMSLSATVIDGRGSIRELIDQLVERTQRSFTICRVWIHKAGK